MIEFHSKDQFYKKPFGAVPQNTEIFFKIRIIYPVSVIRATLIITGDNGSEKSRIETAGRTDNGNGYQWESTLSFLYQAEEIGLFFYCFEVSYADGIKETSPMCQLTVYDETFTTPDWLKNGVMYQIFPDRFAKSEQYVPPLQNKKYVMRDDWGGEPNRLPDEEGVIRNNDFFGGNLKGIEEKLDYLADLGVTVIYLNPIFEAYSNHRYDTADYKKIDPLLGTEKDFIELSGKARKKGIRILLDGVFNHTGSDSIYFNKYGRFPGTGAYQSKESPYYKWYHFTNFPDQYESWWGIDTLPSVNEREASYRDYIIWNEDSVVKHWLRCGASGFRLDVADELPDEFLDDLRYAVKTTDPEAAVLGEVWEDASNKVSYGVRRRYFQGNQLDSVMNYPLKNGILDFLIESRDGRLLEERINQIWENYPKPAFDSLMNILGTHDTPRIFTVLSQYSKDEAEVRQKLFLALLITFFLPGIPCIYYGDEIGMQGGKDPLNRMCFDFEKRDHTIFKFYKRLLAFRSRINRLGDFTFSPGAAHGSFYSFYRLDRNRRIIVAANSGEHDEILDFGLQENEILKDFLISGDVSFETPGSFRIRGCSGAVVYIQCTELSTS